MSESSWPVVVDGVVRNDGRVDVLVLGGGFQHGEGLFETLPIIGGRPGFLTRHLDRLGEGARWLELLPVPEEDAWLADLAALRGLLGGQDLAVRLFLFRDGERVRRVAAAGPLPNEPTEPAKVGLASPPLDRPRTLARFKTMNYLGPRLAHRRGSREGWDEVLFTHEDGTLLEGTRSSLFLVKDGVLRTAPLSLPVLPGVTREVLLLVAREAGIPVHEVGFDLETLLSADEAFLSASLRGVRPVETVAGQRLRIVDGPMTRRLAELYGARSAHEVSEPIPPAGDRLQRGR